MKPDRNYDCGVIVGRFQVPDLHQGHRDLIDHVCNEHKKVLIVLGKSPVENTLTNPLDFEMRKQMIQQVYPHVTILPLMDQWSDEVWSRNLDAVVTGFLSPTQNALLYGGRDSFIKAYTGRYPSEPLRQEGHLSGTAIREAIRREALNSRDFRAGVTWASANRFPTVFVTVDCGIFNKDWTKIILGRKPGENGWRLPGGFADPLSLSFEEDAEREALEETLCHMQGTRYLSSHSIEDWRYQGEPDCIRTMLFVGWTDNDPQAADDLADAQWFWPHDVQKDNYEMVMPQHRELVRMACDFAYPMSTMV